MLDLHSRIRTELDRRLAIARGAEPGPWEVGPTFGALDNRVYVRQAGDLVDSIGTCVFAGQVTNMPRFRATAAFIAAHNPSDAILRYTRDLAVLERHALSRSSASHAFCAPGCQGGDCSRCGSEYPCPDIHDLAESLGIPTTPKGDDE